MTLGARLLSGLLAILAAAGLALGVVAYLGLEKALLAEVEGRVLARLSWLESGLELDEGKLELDPKRDASGGAATWSVRVADGRLLWSSGADLAGAEVLRRTTELHLQEGVSPVTTLAAFAVDEEGDAPAVPPLYRIAEPDGSLVLRLAAAESTAPAYVRLRELRLRMALGGAGGLLVLGLAFFLFVRRAVRPLAEIAAAVGRIDYGRLDRRLPGDGGPAEVADIRAAVNRMLGRLEDGAELQARFAALASHELRTPLAGIRLEAELALRGRRGADDCREALAGILEETRRLEELIHGLLLLARSRPAAGAADKCLELDELLDAVRDAAPARRVEAPHGTAGLLLRGDRELLAIALRNLLRNAVRHGLTEAPRLGVEQDERHVILRVADDGPGFAAPPESGAGTGLGLDLARRAAEACGAALEIEPPQPGRSGAVVSLRIPRALADEPDDGATEQAGSRGRGIPRRGT